MGRREYTAFICDTIGLTRLLKLVSSNKEDIREACEHITNLVTYFRLAITDGDPLSPALNNTINQLAKYVFERAPRMHLLMLDRQGYTEA